MISRTAVPVLVLAISLSIIPAVASAFCAIDGPGSVVACYGQAFAERDIVGLGNLLAPDYSSHYLDGSSASGGDRDFALRGFLSIFGKVAEGGITQMKLDLGSDFEITEGDAPGTWVLSGIESVLDLTATMTGKTQPSSHTVKQELTWFVREVPEPQLHYVIYREEIHQDW